MLTQLIFFVFCWCLSEYRVYFQDAIYTEISSTHYSTIIIIFIIICVVILPINIILLSYHYIHIIFFLLYTFKSYNIKLTIYTIYHTYNIIILRNHYITNYFVDRYHIRTLMILRWCTSVFGMQTHVYSFVVLSKTFCGNALRNYPNFGSIAQHFSYFRWAKILLKTSTKKSAPSTTFFWGCWSNWGATLQLSFYFFC